MSVLLKLWSDWNPLGFPETGAIHNHYEALAIMTLQTMKCHPDHEELVSSLKYFIGIESGRPLQANEQPIQTFAEKILNNDALTAVIQRIGQ